MTGISYAHSLLSLNIICMCVNLTIVPDIVSYLQLQHNLQNKIRDHLVANQILRRFSSDLFVPYRIVCDDYAQLRGYFHGFKKFLPFLFLPPPLYK